VKIIQSDTSFLNTALNTFIATDQCSPAQVRTLLEFCNHIILADTLAYDGQVRQWTEDRLAPSINKVAKKITDGTSRQTFLNLFSSIVLEKGVEEQALRETISESTSFIRPLIDNVGILTPYVKGRGPTSPETYLFPHLRKKEKISEDYLASLLANKSITGRRFYWAMLANSDVRNRLARTYEERGISNALLNILFTRFRVHFAGKRGAAINPDEHLYIPGHQRRNLMRRIFDLVPNAATYLTPPLEPKDLASRLVSATDPGSEAIATFRPRVYPGLVSLAVQYFKPTDRENFLQACVEARELESVKKIRSIEEQLNSEKDPAKATGDLVRFAVDIYAKNSTGVDPEAEATRSLILSWILALFSFIPPNLSTIATVAGVFKDTSEHIKQWRLQRKRHGIFLARDLMPCILPGTDVVESIRGIFGTAP